MSYKLSSERKKCLEESSTRRTTRSKESTKSSIKDVDLSLEVEMDDDIRDIISSPEKFQSTLLDVTVFKENDLNSVYAIETSTLNTDGVRNLIASMEIEKQYKKNLIDKILKQKLSKSDLINWNNETKNTENDEANVCEVRKERNCMKNVVNEETTNIKVKSISEISQVQQVFTSPRTYKDVKSIFACKNQNAYNNNEKPNVPCTCKNCAILGVIQDSQKRPYLEQSPCETFVPTTKNVKNFADAGRESGYKKKNVSFKGADDEDLHVECRYHFKILNSKIKQLEARLAKQEEKSVGKDYFKRIITKLVNHVTKLSHHQDKYYHHDREPPPQGRDKNTRSNKQYDHYYHNRYSTHPLIVDDNKVPPNSSNSAELLAGLNEKEDHTFWKWGEEVLRPGVDLKNKIQSMLEDSINKPRPCEKRGWYPRSSKMNVPKSAFGVMQTSRREDCGKRNPASRYTKQRPYTHPIRTANSDSSIDLKQSYKNDRRYTKHYYPKVETKVQYVNPKSNVWGEISSQLSFEIDMTEVDPQNRCKSEQGPENNEAYKMEFLKTLANTKSVDRCKLWHSIWKQALTNGQSKQDNVTIQIPKFKDTNNKSIEIQYTIAELERLLLRRNNSCRRERRRRK